jgi:hypothetical protein
MSRTHLKEVLSIQDPLQQWNWDLILASIPGFGDTRSISYKCVSTQIPNSAVEQVGMEAHGVKLNFAGKRIWSQQWEATFLETRDSSTRDAFVRWHELMRSWKNNSGSYKSEYAVTGALQLYDDRPRVVREFQMYGLFPLEVTNTTLDQASEIIRYSVNFSYDWCEES